MVVRITLALLGFVVSSAIAGQLIFHNEGDSPAASFQYGLFYLTNCGIIPALRGFYPFWLAVLIQLGFGVGLFWVARRHPGVAWSILAIAVAGFAIWIGINAPVLFE
jgi:hypothetical protein